MKRYCFGILAVLAALLLITACGGQEQQVEVVVSPPPETEMMPVEQELHGVTLIDNFQWLEDQQSPETREWIEKQNEYTDSILNQLPNRDELKEKLTKLIKIDTISTPFEEGGRYFYSKRGADQDLSVMYYREGLEGEEIVLMDPHELSEDHTISTGFTDISADGKWMLYSIRRGGVDEVEIRAHDIDAGEDMEFALPANRYYGASFTKDKQAIIYTAYTDKGPRTYFHQIGTDIEDDKLIFGEGYGPEKITFIGQSENGKWLVAAVMHGSSGGIDFYISPFSNSPQWKTVIADGTTNSSLDFADDTLIITTNLDAPKYRVMTATAQNPGVDNWTELLPEREDAVLRGVATHGGKLVVNYIENVQSAGAIYELDGTKIRDISFDSIGSFGTGSGSYDSNEVFISFSSFHIPPVIYRYDIETGEKTEWARIDVPVDSDSMVLKQEWYESADGTQVPMFILHKKGIELNGQNPTLIYGYGGFNSSQMPRFSGTRAAWVEMGGVYVVVNLRGGGEFGEEWHQAGMMKNKQNTFDDLHSAAEWLIANNYTNSDQLGIMGGSNGGLLVGAGMTQRPELYDAVVCSYPLLDMVNYHKFMVARFWVPEYGSSEDPEMFEYIRAYSPYHNVEEGVDYPATLFITGDGDTRVAPLHARKMAALVQKMNGGENPILLRYHTKAGHSGGMPVSEQIANAVDTYSFLWWRLSE